MIGRSKKSVQTALQFVFFLLIVAVFLAYMSYFIISEYGKIKARAFETVSSNTLTISTFMDEEIKNINTVMQNVAYSNLVKEHFLTYLNRSVSQENDSYSEMQNIKVLTDLLTAIMGPSRPADQIYLYSLDSGYVGVGLDNTNSDDSVHDMPWYDSLMKSGKSIVFCDQDERLKKYFTYEEGSRFLTICSVYQSSFYKPQGVIEVKRSISSLASNLKRMASGAYNEKICIFDSAYNTIYTSMNSEDVNACKSFLSETAVPGDDTCRHFTYDNDTQLFVTGSSYSDFITVISVENSEIYRPLYDFIRSNLIIFFVFVVLILLLSYVVSKAITTPLQKMYTNIASLHTGNDSAYGTLDKIDTNVIELDTLYSAVVEMNDRARASMDREIALNNQRLQSQILALQSQMNPHFLYNSLATISAMADEGMNEEVTTMCQTISRILRYISSDKEPLVPIKEDISHARDYLECMKMRYGDDLIYEINIPDEMENLMIPKLCLQLIAENSIKYSTKSVLPPWKIYIDGHMTGIYWEISVRDNGTGFSADDLNRINEQIDYIDRTRMLPSLEINGMGLMNIYIRFKTLYHGKHIFRVSNYATGGALVTIGGELTDSETGETEESVQNG
ncbi:MAG: histidine kinase [Lachnospiraceae bacterium]|nr:histidine kinase [Lachnospiraceae bacterium]